MAGIILFVFFISAVIYMHFSTWKENAMAKRKTLVIILVVFFLQVIIMKLISLIEPEFDLLIAFLFPTALASMLVKLLTNERLALMITIVTRSNGRNYTARWVCSHYPNGNRIIHIIWGLTSLYLLGNVSRRSTILGTSLGVAVSNLLFLAILFTNDSIFLYIYRVSLLCGCCNYVGCPFRCINNRFIAIF